MVRKPLDPAIYVRMPADLKDWVEAEAQKMAMPLSTYVRLLIIQARQSAHATPDAP